MRRCSIPVSSLYAATAVPARYFFAQCIDIRGNAQQSVQMTAKYRQK